MTTINQQDKSLINQAIKLKNENKHNQSLDILKSLIGKYPYEPLLYGLIGSNYYLQENYKDSSLFFNKTISLSPSSEIASLGLYHSLIELCHTDLAFQEMDRFLSNNKPKEYKTTLKELHDRIDDKGFDEKQTEMISKYYRLYVEMNCNGPSYSEFERSGPPPSSPSL